ncbi:hypothetical protein VIGAN_05006300 [Vigna angularis var. angularis]|uniref:Uncharacterized protein n=1 Tax=Vigna angularis var. angularis TaxID=157739 RepID=A0A0S3S1P7_PHAAN|nr:hypothetical protein VIGAN_05006300 [Vigna angularis var. angularis]
MNQRHSPLACKVDGFFLFFGDNDKELVITTITNFTCNPTATWLYHNWFSRLLSPYLGRMQPHVPQSVCLCYLHRLFTIQAST